MDFTFDTSDLDALAVDLGKAGRKATIGALAVIEHAALNIKKDMRKEIRRHPHFKRVVSAITYETRGLSAEIGPEVGKAQGSLAFIAAYGSPTSAAVWDHTSSLRKELPHIERFLGDVAAGALDFNQRGVSPLAHSEKWTREQ